MTDAELDRVVSDALGVKLDPGFDYPEHEWGEVESCWSVIDMSYGEASHCLQDKQECARCYAERCTGTRCERDPVPERCVRRPQDPRSYSSNVELALGALKVLGASRGWICWQIEGAPATRYGVNIVCPGVTFRGEADYASEAICRAIVAAVRRGA